MRFLFCSILFPSPDSCVLIIPFAVNPNNRRLDDNAAVAGAGVAAVAGVDVGGGLPRDPQGDIPEEQQPTQRQWNFQKRKGRKRKGPVIARRRKKSVFDYDSMRSRFDLDQQARSQEIMAAVNRESDGISSRLAKRR